MGLNPISHAAIEAWSRLYKIDLLLWEVSVLDTLDLQFRIVESEKSEAPKSSVQDMAQDAADLRTAIAAKAAREEEAKRNG